MMRNSESATARIGSEDERSPPMLRNVLTTNVGTPPGTTSAATTIDLTIQGRSANALSKGETTTIALRKEGHQSPQGLSMSTQLRLGMNKRGGKMVMGTTVPLRGTDTEGQGPDQEATHQGTDDARAHHKRRRKEPSSLREALTLAATLRTPVTAGEPIQKREDEILIE